MENLRKIIGPVPNDSSPLRKKMRIHQGWWRAFVLNELPGDHPTHSEESVCNTIKNGDQTVKNFLSTTIATIVNICS